MMPLCAGQLQMRFGGQLIGAPEQPIGEVTTDSRRCTSKQTFVALKGDRFDAHDFVVDVLVQQPALLVLNRQWAEANSALLAGQTVWMVEDTLAALGGIARLAREAFTGPLVGITGSSGKTSVKEMLATIARHTFGSDAVLATQGNLNNHIGVPLTLLRLTPEHKFAIVEMGASGLGEIAALADIARPNVAIVNNVMAAHVAGFGNLDGVATTKAAIYEALGSQGIAVINLDDSYAAKFASQNAKRDVMTFSLQDASAQLYAQEIQLHEDCMSFVLCTDGERVPVTVQVTGLHNVSNCLAAASCARAAGISTPDIVQGLAVYKGVQGRMNILRCSSQVTLIDDTYNANPGSVKAAIDALTAFEGQRWLVLGDMGELGEEAEALHADIGRYARAAGFDQLISVGPLSAAAAMQFVQGQICSTHDLAVAYLQQHIARQAGRINILIKGSRSARMELIVRAMTDQQRNA